VNTNGYYDGFVQQIDRAHKDKLLHKPPCEFVHVASDPLEALDWCEKHVADAAQLADTVVYANQIYAGKVHPAAGSGTESVGRGAALVALGAACGALAVYGAMRSRH
jgi:hypothetical protein